MTGVFSEEATEDEDGINAVDEAGANAVDEAGANAVDEAGANAVDEAGANAVVVVEESEYMSTVLDD